MPHVAYTYNYFEGNAFSSALTPMHTDVGAGLQDTDAPGQAYVLIRARLTISVGRNVARRFGCNKTIGGENIKSGEGCLKVLLLSSCG